MKTAILLFACALISATTIAQDKSSITPKDTTAKPAVQAAPKLKEGIKAPIAKIYKADPNKVYIVQLPEQAIQALLNTSELGVFPYAKALKLPADKLEEFGASFTQLRSVVFSQYKRQFLIDSLRSVDPAKFKSDSLIYFKKPKK